MTLPKYYDRYRLLRRYACPCGHSFVVEREIKTAHFAGLVLAQDDGSFRLTFHPRAASWLYVARYEDALVLEEAGHEPRRLPVDSSLPDFESIAATCPACGRELPPRLCPDCGAPVRGEDREENRGAEGDEEWDQSTLFVICPAGHAHKVLTRLDTRSGN